jgi:hypothetical protein
MDGSSGRVVSGKKLPSPWLLIVSLKKGVAQLEISFSSGATTLKLAKSSVKTHSPVELAQRLGQSETARLAALALLSQMPMAGKLKGAGLTGGRLLPVREFADRKVTPPEKLVLYELNFDRGASIWRSSVKGTLVLKTLSKAEQELVPEDRQFSRERGWVLEKSAAADDSAPLDNTVPLFVHSWEGPGVDTEAYTKEFTRAMKAPLKETAPRHGSGVLAAISPEHTAAFAYLAYGMPLVDQAALLLPNVKLYRGQVVFRGRGLKSFAAEFDVVPRVNEVFFDKTFSIGWRRLGFGVELGMDPGFLADWISVTPRIGLWQLNAVLPARGDGGEPFAIDYGFKAQAAVGYRAAVEFATPLWTAFRFSQGREVTSAALTPGGNESGAQNESYSIEVFFRGLGRGMVVFPYLFISRESAVFSLGKASELDLVGKSGTDKTDAFKETFFELDFAGGGIGVAW